MPIIDVTRTWLEMHSPAELRRAPAPRPDVEVSRVEPCPPSLYRRLYRDVGENYNWRDRAEWSTAQLRRHLARRTVSVWVLRVAGEIAGWFELVRRGDGSVEIAYLGLLPAYHGQGLGKYLLTQAAEQAWAAGAKRVWLHTCSLDSPTALPNYLARGFQRFREDVYPVSLDG